MVNIKYKNGLWSVTTKDGKEVPVTRITLDVQSKTQDTIDCTLYVDEFDVDIPREQVSIAISPPKTLGTLGGKRQVGR